MAEARVLVTAGAVCGTHASSDSTLTRSVEVEGAVD